MADDGQTRAIAEQDFLFDRAGLRFDDPFEQDPVDDPEELEARWELMRYYADQYEDDEAHLLKHKNREEEQNGFRIKVQVIANNQRAPGDITIDRWFRICGAWRWECAYCATWSRVFAMDHVVPVSKGGPSDTDNLVPCCKRCNSSKGAKPVEEWLEDDVDWFLERWERAKERLAASNEAVSQ
jgi:5-methylcytosine-specific restriction endonuclease McrA